MADATAWTDRVLPHGDGEAAFLQALGRRLRLARHTLSLSQQQLADRAGLSRNFISGLERGTHGADVLRLRRLASALGVDLRDLVPPPS